MATHGDRPRPGRPGSAGRRAHPSPSGGRFGHRHVNGRLRSRVDGCVEVDGACYSAPPGFRPRRTPAETLQLLARAHRAGHAIGQLCTRIHEHDGPLGVRRILGVLAFAKPHGVGAVETACATALELGVPGYRFVRRYLERRLPSRLTLRQIDPLIRKPTFYRDLIDRRCEKEVRE